MDTSTAESQRPIAVQVAVTDDALTVDLVDGRTLSSPLAWYPRLAHATVAEWSNSRLIGRGEGIHWDDLDEDTSIESLLAGLASSESQASLERWLKSRRRTGSVGKSDSTTNCTTGLVMKLGTQIKRVTKVDPESYAVTLLYTDGFKGTVDLSFLFGSPKKPLVLEILRGGLFATCFAESGALVWPNGFELCPDTIRSWTDKRRHRAA